MERVIVTVRRTDESRERDIEIAADLPVEQLVMAVAQALSWIPDAAGQPVSYEVEAHPPGRMLRPDETLAQAQAWDGTRLVFHPHNAPPTPPPSDRRDQSEPVIGWHPLSLPTAPSPSPTHKPSSSDGFAWKQVDEAGKEMNVDGLVPT